MPAAVNQSASRSSRSQAWAGIAIAIAVRSAARGMFVGQLFDNRLLRRLPLVFRYQAAQDGFDVKLRRSRGSWHVGNISGEKGDYRCGGNRR